MPTRGACRVASDESHRRVDVRAGDVRERVDHRHHHETEGERDTDVPESSSLGVDHDRAAAEEHERKRPEGLRAQDASTVAGHGLTQRSRRRGSARRPPIRSSVPGFSR